MNRKKTAELVVGEKFGRLANRLWLFSHVIAHGIESGARVWNPCFDEYAGYFAGTARGIIPAYPPFGKNTTMAGGARSLAYSLFFRVVARLRNRDGQSSFYSIKTTGINETFDLSQPEFSASERSKRVIILAGWRFRDYDAFDKHEDEIRTYFQPADDVASSVCAILDKARRGVDVLVGLHIRSGDFRTFLGGKYYYTPTQYRSLADRAALLFPGQRVRFLICSDEPVDATAFSGVDFVSGSGTPVEDLVAFSGCDYIIGPPSTYTMWSSFHGRVPLLVVRSASQQPDLAEFRVMDGRFDVEADAV